MDASKINQTKRDDMKKRMNDLEDQLKIQNENLNKISSLANKKEEKLNSDISQYLKQINDLKNELELLNSTITNLTEEKENNTIKLTELIHENEQLKKNKNSSPTPISNDNNTGGSEIQNKKYEDLIIKLKKNIMKLNEEKKSLEEVIFKQEEKVNELSKKVDNTKKEIIKKDKELKESIEYNAKLTSTINFHKKEIQKLKQSTTNNNNNNNPNNLNNNKNKDVMNIMNLQKEIQTIKKEIETKDNKINLLSMNNKILQGKVNKLSQTTKNGFHFDSNTNTNAYNVRTTINQKNNDNKTLHKDKNKVFIIAKPKQSQHLPGMFNGRQNSTNIRAKNDFYKNNEDNSSNYFNNENGNKSKYTNLHQIRKTQRRNNSNINNINNIKMQNNYNMINAPNMNYMNINTAKSNYINKNNINSEKNSSLDNKYKEIESKYKKEINKEMKDNTLFDEDIINNFDIKEEIIVGNSIEPVEVVSNMVSQTLKPKKKKQYILNEQSLNQSQEKDFQIIESYCYLSGQKEDNENNNNYDNSQMFFNKDNSLKENESKIEKNQVQELHNHVQKILDEFN